MPPDLGLNRLMALPQPFRSSDEDLPLIHTSGGQNDIAVPSIAGLSAEDHRRIWEALSKAADENDILVLSGVPDRPTYVLEGVAARSPDVLTIKWYLRNSAGALVRKFDVSAQLAAGPADALTGSAAGAIAEQTGTALSAAMAAKGGVMTAPVSPGRQQRATSGPPKILIGKVTGAPGDGDRSLPAALKTTLAQDGALLTEDEAKADFTLIAKIAREPLKNGSESIAITWQVIDPKGVVAGEISQSNEIEAGSLDGRWGQTAFDIALAAESGLGDMLNEIEARASGVGAPEDAPAAGPVIPNSVVRRHTDPGSAPAVGKAGG